MRIQGTRIVYADIVAIDRHPTTRVTLNTRQGDELTVSAEGEVIDAALDRFGKGARCKLLSDWDQDMKRRDLALLAVEPWERRDFLEAMDEIRAELKAEGVVLDGAEFQRNMFGDDS